jgi:hypothetical protein
MGLSSRTGGRVDGDTTPAERAANAERRANTPVAGAIAGILFAVLFTVGVSILATHRDRPQASAGKDEGHG